VSAHEVTSGVVYQPMSAVCGLLFTTSLHGGCCVSHPAWWMLVVLDLAVCLQSNKRRLLLMNSVIQTVHLFLKHRLSSSTSEILVRAGSGHFELVM